MGSNLTEIEEFPQLGRFYISHICQKRTFKDSVIYTEFSWNEVTDLDPRKPDTRLFAMYYQTTRGINVVLYWINLNSAKNLKISFLPKQ